MFFRKTRMEDQTNPTEQAPQNEAPIEAPVEQSQENPQVEQPQQEAPVVEEAAPIIDVPQEPVVEQPPLNSCPNCNGEGLNDDQTARCTRCQGTGKI